MKAHSKRFNLLANGLEAQGLFWNFWDTPSGKPFVTLGKLPNGVAFEVYGSMFDADEAEEPLTNAVIGIGETRYDALLDAARQYATARAVEDVDELQHQALLDLVAQNQEAEARQLTPFILGAISRATGLTKD